MLGCDIGTEFRFTHRTTMNNKHFIISPTQLCSLIVLYWNVRDGNMVL